jgi:hypothetical protein
MKNVADLKSIVVSLRVSFNETWKNTLIRHAIYDITTSLFGVQMNSKARMFEV